MALDRPKPLLASHLVGERPGLGHLVLRPHQVGHDLGALPVHANAL